MYFAINLLDHFKLLHACMKDIGGKALVDADDFSLEVRIGQETRRFVPQFTFIRKDGQRRYTPTFGPTVRNFIGWRPALLEGWPLSSEKLLFKAHAEANGLSTPQYWQAPAADIQRFLVKRNKSSLGYDIRGPFEQLNPANPAHRLAEGEYYEAFIPGRIAKAWYCDGDLTCLELRPPPNVVGDGRTSILELATRRSSRGVDRPALARIVNSQGFRVDDVPAEGKRVVVDFKYGSPYEIPSFENENVIARLRDTPIGAELKKAGKIFQQAIPEDIRESIFTLDAVVDAQDRVWLLEMNCNPALHPDIYPAMLKCAFARHQLIDLNTAVGGTA